ncbi:hypothetical protein Emed_001196 [Eimeria media]
MLGAGDPDLPLRLELTFTDACLQHPQLQAEEEEVEAALEEAQGLETAQGRKLGEEEQQGTALRVALAVGLEEEGIKMGRPAADRSLEGQQHMDLAGDNTTDLQVVEALRKAEVGEGAAFAEQEKTGDFPRRKLVAEGEVAKQPEHLLEVEEETRDPWEEPGALEGVQTACGDVRLVDEEAETDVEEAAEAQDQVEIRREEEAQVDLEEEGALGRWKRRSLDYHEESDPGVEGDEDGLELEEDRRGVQADQAYEVRHAEQKDALPEEEEGDVQPQEDEVQPEEEEELEPEEGRHLLPEEGGEVQLGEEEEALEPEEEGEAEPQEGGEADPAEGSGDEAAKGSLGEPEEGSEREGEGERQDEPEEQGSLEEEVHGKVQAGREGKVLPEEEEEELQPQGEHEAQDEGVLPPEERSEVELQEGDVVERQERCGPEAEKASVDEAVVGNGLESGEEGDLEQEQQEKVGWQVEAEEAALGVW